MYDRNRIRRCLLLALLAGLASLVPAAMSAQAKKTATRSAEFDAFGGFTYVDKNYIQPHVSYGGTLGGDYTQFFPRYHGRIIPSVQVRATFAPGSFASEKTIEGGFRLSTTYRRLHPYGDLLVGDGIITFSHPTLQTDGRLYQRDSGFLYVYGGGITYDTTSDFSAMVDYQQQYWNLGEHPPLRFYPHALTFGVVYHIPFKAYKTR